MQNPHGLLRLLNLHSRVLSSNSQQQLLLGKVNGATCVDLKNEI